MDEYLYYFIVTSCALLVLIRRRDDVSVKFSHALHGFGDYWKIFSHMCMVGVLCFSNPEEQLICQPILLSVHPAVVYFGLIVYLMMYNAVSSGCPQTCESAHFLL